MTEPIKLPPCIPATSEARNYARLAVEQNTAELRAEVERLRAELARLTTLRPHACDDEYDGEKLFWGKDGDSWICDPLFVHSTHWTPLPDVKEPK
jgi:hypothetical protein